MAASMIKALLLALVVCLAHASNLRAEDPPKRVWEIGALAAQTVTASLKAELHTAMKAGGPAGAVEICSRKALDITSQVADELGVSGLQIKRTSLRIRNARNRPDGLEKDILREYAQSDSQGLALEPRIVDAGLVWRYFSPIRVGSLCVLCHGDVDRIARSVAGTLETYYPADEAVGYRPGDLRGIFSVTIPKASLAETENDL